MLSLLPVSSPQGPYPLRTLPASRRMLSHPHTYSCLSVLAFPYPGSSSFHRNKGPVIPYQIIFHYISWSYLYLLFTFWMVV